MLVEKNGELEGAYFGVVTFGHEPHYYAVKVRNLQIDHRNILSFVVPRHDTFYFSPQTLEDAEPERRDGFDKGEIFLKGQIEEGRILFKCGGVPEVGAIAGDCYARTMEFVRVE